MSIKDIYQLNDVKTMLEMIEENRNYPNIVESLNFTLKEMIEYHLNQN